MNLIPEDIAIYFCENDTEVLYQGDIIDANGIGLKAEGQNSPDYWMIITKSCDLAFRNGIKKVKSDHFSLIPLITLRQIRIAIVEKYFKKPQNDFLGKIVLAGILKFSQSTKSITKPDHIKNLIEDKISKLMLLPPDGKVLSEPMVIDFDLIQPLDGGEIENILKSKSLQLSSPFRERVSQRFALHYMQIGIDDDNVKAPDYRKALLKHFNDSK